MRNALVVITLFLLFTATMQAQQRVAKPRSGGSFTLNDSLTTYSQSDIFDLPNINKQGFYYNVKELKEMNRLNKSSQNARLYPLLRKYVRSFGIENFRKNVPMLWRLARLSEKYGPPGEALLLYRLVIKHHRQGIDIKRLLHVYDSIETDKKELYVPLDYYYQLVELRKQIDTLRPPHSILINMGDAINSPKADYGPAIGNVDSILLFTSKRNVNQVAGSYMVDEDIFVSSLSGDIWNKATEFDAINTTYNEGSACFSLDGKFLFFSRCEAANSLGNCDLYVSTLNQDGSWSAGKNLGKAINSPAWDSHPSLNHSGDTLFFASNRLGGFGMSDIYFSVKDEDGKWQKAQNAGPIINTLNSEVSPFFHHQSNVLYFSSNGHPLNFGAFDIYKTFLRGKYWDDPKNIGPLVNGVGSEYYFTIDAKSKNLYYARSPDKESKDLDIYSFPVPMAAQPKAVAHLSGSLKIEGAGKRLMNGIVSVIDLDEGVEVAPKFLRPDGSFDFDLINKRNYLLIIQGDNFFRFEEVFFMDGDITINRYAEPIKSRVEFKSLEFENGKADILESMYNDLRKMGSFLTDHPGLKLTIHGHTDATGREEDNLILSQKRADAIKNYLVNKFSIKSPRIKSIGHGSSKPIINERSERANQLNRRVEFEVYRDR